MKDPIPAWASRSLSESLKEVCAAGESKTVDFKGKFPEQAHRLGKTIAAMATSGGGKIYIGIEDDGDLQGLDLSDGEMRDDAFERAHSIAGSVNPRPGLRIEFAYDSGKTVLVVEVLAGKHPVYYYDGRPYVRDGRKGRPAEPEEVVELIWKHPSSEHRLELERLNLQVARELAERNSMRFRTER